MRKEVSSVVDAWNVDRQTVAGAVRRPIAMVALALMAVVFGCADPERGAEAGAYYDEPTTTTVGSSLEFTDEAYDFSGEMTIAELRSLVPPMEDERVWLGFSPDDPYPVEGDCNPEFTGGETVPATLDDLPAYIEGVVTLHPRYFENTTVCGSRERYYGTYVLQDETTGIHVLKNSRLGEFDVGDRVRLRVRGVTREHSMVAVLTFDNEEVLTERDERYAVYYQELDREFDPDEDLYEVRRITGEVVVEATNQNFNEMVVRSQDDPELEWLVSMDRELGLRGVSPAKGEVVQLTGPVVDSFGLRMLIASLGKIEVLE